MAVRRRLQRRGHEGLYSSQREHLLLGTTLLDGLDWPDYTLWIKPDEINGNWDHWQFPFRDEEHRRQVWEEHGERLTAEWQRQPNNAGRHPAAWWEYDSGEERGEGETRSEFLKRCKAD